MNPPRNARGLEIFLPWMPLFAKDPQRPALWKANCWMCLDFFAIGFLNKFYILPQRSWEYFIIFYTDVTLLFVYTCWFFSVFNRLFFPALLGSTHSGLTPKAASVEFGGKLARWVCLKKCLRRFLVFLLVKDILLFPFFVFFFFKSFFNLFIFLSRACQAILLRAFQVFCIERLRPSFASC